MGLISLMIFMGDKGKFKDMSFVCFGISFFLDILEVNFFIVNSVLYLFFVCFMYYVVLKCGFLNF